MSYEDFSRNTRTDEFNNFIGLYRCIWLQRVATEILKQKRTSENET